MLNWNLIWMQLFGTTELFGINLGFWAALFVIGIVVIAMNLIFWTRPRCTPHHLYPSSFQNETKHKTGERPPSRFLYSSKLLKK